MAVNYQKVVIRVGLLSWQKLFLPEQFPVENGKNHGKTGKNSTVHILFHHFNILILVAASFLASFRPVLDLNCN